MKLREKLCAALTAVVLLQLLAGCGAQVPAGTAPAPDSTPRPFQGQREAHDPVPTEPAPPSREPSPTLAPGLWDPDHRLDISFTPSSGLELPIQGATGYASVKLPLWPELPQGQEGKLAAIYAPQEPEPAPSPAPTAEPEPTPTPGPAATAEPEPSVLPPAPTQELPAEATGEPSPSADQPVPQTDTPSAGPEAVDPPPADGAEPSQSPEESEGPPVPPTGEPLPTPAASDPPPEPVPTPEPEPTATPQPTPEPTPDPTPAPDPMEGALLVLEPGAAFLILDESGDWWQVTAQGVTGWVEHRYCLINLPDVVPSMVYDNTNSYSSVFVSSGREIPGITGRALYQSKAQNPRLGREEFLMPVLYAMAKNVCRAQQNALAEGNTLVLYEGFRPYDAQMAVVRSLTALSAEDEAVEAGISTRPWSISWFIATGASNHQEGYAVDVSLAKVAKAHTAQIGGYSFVQVDEYEEYAMPTPVHELSMSAATYTKPVAIFSNTAWRSAVLAPAMAASPPALALQRYCTSAKLSPRASEWWHFNDLAAHGQIRAYPSQGNYRITQCLSVEPW